MPCILTRCRAFILPRCNTAPYKRLQRVLPCLCNYTARVTKQHTGLYSGFSCDCTLSTAHDNTPVQTATMLSVPRWMACQRPDALNQCQIPPPRPDAVQVSTAAYYNKVYIRGCSISQTLPATTGQRLHLHRVSPAGSRCFSRPATGGLAPGQRSGRAVWHPPPGGAVQRQGRGGRRGTTGGYHRISFRAFAR